MGRWVNFSKTVVDRITERVGESAAQIIFALQTEIGKVRAEVYPTIVVVWGDWTRSSKTKYKTRVVSIGSARFSVHVLAKSHADPASTAPFLEPDDIQDRIRNCLFGWATPALATNPANRLYVAREYLAAIEGGVVELVSDWDIEHEIVQEADVNE